jgi:hypothetical protein
MADEAPRRSLFLDSCEEAGKYRWIASEQAGFDLGESAVHQWVRDHWQGFLRVRWIEHLEGKCFWVELEHCDFGFLANLFPEQTELLESVLDQLKCGRENLDVLCWAKTHPVSTSDVMRMLEAIDINSARMLASRFNLLPPTESERPLVVNGHG